MATKKTFSNEYRNKAIEYVKEHPDIPINKAANNLNIAPSTLHKWIKASKENNGVVNMPGSGNSTTSREKELERELKNTKDALEILKKAISILGS